MKQEVSAVSFSSLMAPTLCDLQPSIDRGPKKLRFCHTCRKQIAKPYACPRPITEKRGAADANR